MPRVTNAVYTKARRKRILKKAKGYFGNKSRLYRYAKDAVQHAEIYAYAHRRRKKGDFRSLWIARLNAAVRPSGLSYSRFMAGLRAANIALDRKSLSELAIHDTEAFAKIIEQAKAALAAPAKA
ncbi:MAG: 50S ribosomal protein L20 [Opitutales bacterium]|jgi:large subunit ribosomal protein L20